MKIPIRSSTTTITSILTVVGLLIVFGVFSFGWFGRPAQAQTENGRLITVHDRGSQQTFVTDKPTLREAFTEIGIAIDAQDAVEPGLDETLVAPDYQVNIYRARPVTVVDGATRTKIVTPFQSAERIAEDANIVLYPEDVTVLERSGDIIGDGAGLQLTIKRATLLTITLFGKVTQVRTQAETVEAFLGEKGIAIGSQGGAENRVSVPLSTKISAATTFLVWREGKQTITVEEVVAFETQQIKDADRELGYKQVQTPGQNGTRTVTYEVDIQNGAEVSRVSIASVVITEPIKQVEVIGAKMPTPTSPTESQAIGHEMMLAAGYGEEQWSCLYSLWMKESGWRTTAGNPSSGAYGIPQSLPASKMATFGSDYATNPRTQIAWGLNYIKNRYSTPCGAWSAFNSRSPTWY